MLLVGSTLACDSHPTPTTPSSVFPAQPQLESVISGTVTEIDGGPVAAAKIYAHPSGRTTTSSADGSFSFAAPGPTYIRFTATGFEELTIAVKASQHVVVNGRMRQSLRVGVNDTIKISLAASDPGEANTQFGYSWCEPCRVIRIQTDRQRDIDVTVRWNSPAVLGLWNPHAQEFAWAENSGTAFTARVRTQADETIVYIGSVAYAGPPLVEPMMFEVVTTQRD